VSAWRRIWQGASRVAGSSSVCTPNLYVLHALLDAVGVLIPHGVVRPEVENAVVAVSEISEPLAAFVDAGFVADHDISEPLAAFVDVEFVADVAEPQACVDIALAFDASVPVSVVAVETDSPGHPSFLAFPNVDHYASSSSRVGGVLD
jgi:hypothetical protein